MVGPLHAVAEVPQYIRDVTAAGLSPDEQRVIIDTIAENPTIGVEVRGSGGVRKVRVAGRGKGKSGGYRIMVAYMGPSVPVLFIGFAEQRRTIQFLGGGSGSVQNVDG